MKAERETDVQRAVLQYLRLVLHWTAARVNSGRLRDRTGRPVRMNDADGCSDVLAVAACGVRDPDGAVRHPPGRFAAIEVKRGDAKPTARQSAFLDAVRAAGGLAIVTNGVEDLRRQLREAGYDAP